MPPILEVDDYELNSDWEFVKSNFNPFFRWLSSFGELISGKINFLSVSKPNGVLSFNDASYILFFICIAMRLYSWSGD